MSSGSTPPSRCRPQSAPPPPQPITGFANSTPNEENTEDGIIYENTVGDPNAAGGAIPADPTNPTTVTPPVDSVAAAAMYIYSAGKFSTEWNDPTDYNSSTTNIVEQGVTGSTSANTVGNFLAGTLSLASVRSTTGIGRGVCGPHGPELVAFQPGHQPGPRVALTARP